MKNDPIRTKVLSIRLIPNADRFLLKAMQVQEGHRSLGLITTDCDDVSYAASDEATKKADVSVAMQGAMYAGSPMPVRLLQVSLSVFCPVRIRRM